MVKKQYFKELLKNVPVSQIQFITEDTVRIAVFGGFWFVSYLAEPSTKNGQPLVSTSFIGLITIDSTAEFIAADELANRFLDQIA